MIGTKMRINTTDLEPLKLNTQCYCTSFQLANYIAKLYPVVKIPEIQELIIKYIGQEGNVLEYDILKHQVDEHEVTALLRVFSNIVYLMEKECLPKQFLVLV